MVFTHRDVRSIDAIASGDLSRSFHARALFLCVLDCLFIRMKYSVGGVTFLKKKSFFGTFMGIYWV